MVTTSRMAVSDVAPNSKMSSWTPTGTRSSSARMPASVRSYWSRGAVGLFAVAAPTGS
jgi:hypothetical protein